MPLADSQMVEVERLIGPSLEAMGFRLVRLALTGETGQPTLQIMAGITVIIAAGLYVFVRERKRFHQH